MRDSEIQRSEQQCSNCELQDSWSFCNFQPETRSAFDRIKIAKRSPKGSRLFTEGQPADGIFIVCRGKVKLTTYSQTGKALIMRVAVPGDVIGISAAFSGGMYETSAEVIDAARLNFVRSTDFRRFLEQFPDAAMNAITALCREYKTAYTQIRSLGLTSCVADKLALLLLDWSKGGASCNGSVHLSLSFSHEAIAEMIGSSRETVTRLLKEFRQQDLIRITGNDLCIPDKRRLEATIGNGKKRSNSAVSHISNGSGEIAIVRSRIDNYLGNGDDAHIRGAGGDLE